MDRDREWEIVMQLYAVGELLKHWDGRRFDNDVLPGLGLLLLRLGDQLAELHPSDDDPAT